MCVYSSSTAVPRLRECEREWPYFVARRGRSRFLCAAAGRDAGCVWDGGVGAG